CKKPEGGTSESQAAPTATSSTAAGGGEEEAKDLFKTRCVPCHGDQGKGNGPGAAALNPKPRNYTDATWQASVTDEQLKKTIVGGGAAVGKSPNMPANPDLEGKDAELNGLVAIIRGFKGK
ncbi:MAG TPA: c-type cytochrome, partial [Polyangiaceae bacterium]|nr:c-type cytochrome [Polyangiaceae bacterium]